jgi:hypothetical protein
LKIEQDFRAFLRGTPDRIYSTHELTERFPEFKTQASRIAERFPELVARKEAFVAKRGMLRGKRCHHYYWQDDGALPAAQQPENERWDEIFEVVRLQGHRIDQLTSAMAHLVFGETELADLRAACTAEFKNLQITDRNLEQRIERLERIARMIGHDL